VLKNRVCAKTNKGGRNAASCRGGKNASHTLLFSLNWGGEQGLPGRKLEGRKKQQADEKKRERKKRLARRGRLGDTSTCLIARSQKNADETAASGHGRKGER